jgi:hypothetical protein
MRPENSRSFFNTGMIMGAGLFLGWACLQGKRLNIWDLSAESIRINLKPIEFFFN